MNKMSSTEARSVLMGLSNQDIMGDFRGGRELKKNTQPPGPGAWKRGSTVLPSTCHTDMHTRTYTHTHAHTHKTHSIVWVQV